MIQKTNLSFKTLSSFCSKKVSADKNNTTYRILSEGDTAHTGEPDVMWQSIAYILDTKQTWTNGKFMSGNPSIVTLDNSDVISQMTEEDTIYEVIYEFDLNEQTLSIPNGCTVRFRGGIIKNGTINLNNAIIDAAPVQIFSDVTLVGYGVADTAFMQWCSLQEVVTHFKHVTITENCYIDDIIIPDKHIIDNHAEITVNRDKKGFCMQNYVEFHGGQVQPLNGASAFTIGGTDVLGRYRRCKIHDTKIFGSSAPGTKGINFITAETSGNSGWEYNCMEEVTNVNIYGCHTGIYGHVRASFFDVIIEGVIEGLKILECNFNVFKLNGNASTRTDSDGTEYPYVLDMGNGSNNTVIGSLYDVGNTGWQKYMVNCSNPRNQYIGVVKPHLQGLLPDSAPEYYEHSQRQLITSPYVEVEYDNVADCDFGSLTSTEFKRSSWKSVHRIDTTKQGCVTLKFGDVCIFQGFKLIYFLSAHKYQFDKIEIWGKTGARKNRWDEDVEAMTEFGLIEQFTDGQDGFFYKQTNNLYVNVYDLQVKLYINTTFPEGTERTTQDVRLVSWQLFGAYAKSSTDASRPKEKQVIIEPEFDIEYNNCKSQYKDKEFEKYGSQRIGRKSYSSIARIDTTSGSSITLTFGYIGYYRGFRVLYDNASHKYQFDRIEVYDGDTKIDELTGGTDNVHYHEMKDLYTCVTNLKVVLYMDNEYPDGASRTTDIRVASWQLLAESEKVTEEEVVEIDTDYQVLDSPSVSISKTNTYVLNGSDLSLWGSTTAAKTGYAELRTSDGTTSEDTRTCTLSFGAVYYYQGFRLNYTYYGSVSHKIIAYDGTTELESVLITNSTDHVVLTNLKRNVSNLKIVISMTGNGVLKINSWQLRGAYAERKTESSGNTLMPLLVDIGTIKYTTGIYWFWHSSQKVVKYTSKSGNKATDGGTSGRIMIDVNQKVHIKTTCLAGVIPYFIVDTTSVDTTYNGFKTVIKQGTAPTEDSIIDEWLDVDTTGSYRILLNTKVGESIEVTKYDNVTKEFTELIKCIVG